MEGTQLTVVVAAALHRSSMASKDVTMTMCSGGIGHQEVKFGRLGAPGGNATKCTPVIASQKIMVHPSV